MNIPFFKKKQVKLEDNLSFEQFCKQIQHLPISPNEMEKFKDEARRNLRNKNYTNGDLIKSMYDLYKNSNYRPKCQ